MAREYTRAILQLSCDHRFVAGVGGALAYFAERAGLEEGCRQSLCAAIEEFCLDSLPSIHEAREVLDVAIEDFDDRIEIVIQHCDQVAANGRYGAPLRTAKTQHAPQSSTLRRLAQVADRIERSNCEGRIRTTVIKFLPS